MRRLSRGFFLAIALYFTLHVALRVWMSGALEMDEAEQILFGQWWQWGYSSQPPLYTWLLKLLMSVLEPGPLALSLLKNSLLFSLLALVFASARRALHDDARAVLAAVSLLLIPSIAWESARDLTHTVIAAVMVAWSFHQVLRMLEKAEIKNYAALGGIIGLGMLAKYNFGLHILALTGGLIALPQGRRLLLNWRVGICLLIAAAIYAPHAWWQWHNMETLANGIDKFSERAASPTILSLRLLLDIAAYVLPVLLLAGLLFRGSGAQNSSDAETAEPALAIRKLLLIYFGLLVGVFLLMIWSGGMGRTKVRWLYPFFSLFPILAFAYIPASAITAKKFRIFTGFTAAAATAVIIALLIRVPGARWTGKPTDLNLSFTDFAAHIRQSGFQEGLIIGHNAHFAGNLRRAFGPCCPTFAPHFDLPLPPKISQDLLIVWDAEKHPEPPPRLKEFALRGLNLDLASIEPSFQSIPYQHSVGLQAKIGYLLIPLKQVALPAKP